MALGLPLALLFLFIVIVTALTLAGMLICGIVLGVISAGRIKKKKAAQQKAGAAEIIMAAGSVLLLLVPVSVGGVIAADRISLAVQRTAYRSFADKWRNEHMWSDTQALKDCFVPLLEMSDKNDREGLINAFSENLREAELEKEIDEFLSSCPKGLSECEDIEYQTAGSWGGDGTESMNGRGTASADGVTYYICVSVVYRDDKDPENVGIKFFSVESERAYAKKETDSHKLICYKDASVPVRMVGGHHIEYSESRDVIPYSELLYIMKSCETIDEIIKIHGDPNSIVSSGEVYGSIDYYYETEHDGERPRYICIHAAHNGKIYKKLSYICSDDDLHNTYFDEDGNLTEQE